ncbi:MAG: endonuclease MutS2 [Deltaproteobacteria bacterium]|nr:endonuclease MutS2 [Deltaproteobacteria bacterium]
MDNTTLETLEYLSVLKELAGFAITPLGYRATLELRPEHSAEYIKEVFSEYTEGADIIKVSGKFALGGVTDLKPLLTKLDPVGAYLLSDELQLVLNNIAASSRLKYNLTQSFSKQYPRISARISSLSDQAPLYSELNRIIDEKGQIKDTASTELYHIRKEIRQNKDRSRKILEELTTDKKFKEYLQEDFITIRDDRYVLCIKTGMHTQVNGIIHGRSGSGATYFIEPFPLVELNNRTAILKKEEKAEEIIILKRATGEVLMQREALLADLDAFSALDLLQAKALFAKEIDAIVPVIKDDGEVSFKAARHPLLILKALRGEATVIPIDVMVKDGCKVLVISGANTGGKTVALKTLGLLTLMALSAIPIPADEGSEAVVFDSIYSDIGDRQDIIASLSTFSAHIKRIKEFLSEAGPGSLVLIDEIGAGTDPSEGSAFGLAALETFRAKGAITVITTHLNLIKAHAQADPAYMNASVEFDEKTLKPLYRLHYGVPGPSLGLSIAQSLGIPSDVIDKARTYLKDSEGAFIESVRVLEAEKEEIRKLRETLFSLKNAREKAVEKLRAERSAIVEKVKKRIEAEVNRAKEEIRETIEKFREERARGGMSASGGKAASNVDEISAKLLSKLVPERTIEKYIPAVGDKVAMTGSNTKGVVVAVDEAAKKAELMVGKLKVWVAWDKLIRRGGSERKVQASQAVTIEADMETAQGINIIGMRVEDALPLVTKFLDNAHANGLNTVEIIHGMGTGRLSKAVAEFLSKSSIVKGFAHGDPQMGGAGVTIVELK